MHCITELIIELIVYLNVIVDLFANVIFYINSPADITMQTPILTPSHLQQLSTMVHGILEDNKKKLDDILGSMVELQSTSILRLYNLTVQEWQKKQKTVENLSHFALTMMATVEMLWQQQQTQQENLIQSSHLVENLQTQLHQVTEQNQLCKIKINEAETHIESICGERDRMQELYRSQSCIQLESHIVLSPREGEVWYPSCFNGQKSYIGDEGSRLLFQENSRLLVEKDSYISQLVQQKGAIQSQYDQLMNQNQLIKIQLQLAELAMKDALQFKSQLIQQQSLLLQQSQILPNNKSGIQQSKSLLIQPKSQLLPSKSIQNHTDEAEARQDNGLSQFQGELQCYSRIQFNNQASSSTLLNDLVESDMVRALSSPCFINEQNYSSELMMTPETDQNNCFKKRWDEKCFVQGFEAHSSPINDWKSNSRQQKTKTETNQHSYAQQQRKSKQVKNVRQQIDTKNQQQKSKQNQKRQSNKIVQNKPQMLSPSRSSKNIADNKGPFLKAGATKKRENGEIVAKKRENGDFGIKKTGDGNSRKEDKSMTIGNFYDYLTTNIVTKRIKK